MEVLLHKLNSKVREVSEELKSELLVIRSDCRTLREELTGIVPANDEECVGLAETNHSTKQLLEEILFDIKSIKKNQEEIATAIESVYVQVVNGAGAHQSVARSNHSDVKKDSKIEKDPVFQFEFPKWDERFWLEVLRTHKTRLRVPREGIYFDSNPFSDKTKPHACIGITIANYSQQELSYLTSTHGLGRQISKQFKELGLCYRFGAGYSNSAIPDGSYDASLSYKVGISNMYLELFVNFVKQNYNQKHILYGMALTPKGNSYEPKQVQSKIKLAADNLSREEFRAIKTDISSQDVHRSGVKICHPIMVKNGSFTALATLTRYGHKFLMEVDFFENIPDFQQGVTSSTGASVPRHIVDSYTLDDTRQLELRNPFSIHKFACVVELTNQLPVKLENFSWWIKQGNNFALPPSEVPPFTRHPTIFKLFTNYSQIFHPRISSSSN